MQNDCQFLILFEEYIPIGFASFQKIENNTFKLHKIYILPDQQKKGSGRFFLEHILLHVRKENGKALQLQVNRFNNAKLFYERMGFTVIKEADFEIGNGYFMNDYVMEIQLK